LICVDIDRSASPSGIFHVSAFRPLSDRIHDALQTHDAPQFEGLLRESLEELRELKALLLDLLRQNPNFHAHAESLPRSVVEVVGDVTALRLRHSAPADAFGQVTVVTSR
jgi:hypothetical protein